jgi:hypothetical protein
MSIQKGLLVKISSRAIDIPVEKGDKRSVVLNDQVGTSSQNGSVATKDHEAS